MRLDKLLAEQIIELIDNQTHKLLGAIQDGRVVLGGSAGSAGGVGDPPAGFWGQLRQGNVTYDTAGSYRACSTGSAGSDSLVDNLDAIRLGWEICNDAIGERHIDWGLGAGQVSAVDVPFQTTSGSIDATNVRDAIEETYAECYGDGGGGGGDLDDAYDFGGAGAGRTITADAGAVQIQGLGGLEVGDAAAAGVVESKVLSAQDGWIIIDADEEAWFVLDSGDGFGEQAIIEFRSDGAKKIRFWKKPGTEAMYISDKNDNSLMMFSAGLVRLYVKMQGYGSLFPDLGTTTTAEKMGDVFLGTGKDVYPEDDGGGLFQRAPNHWRTPTDHFNAFAGWTWAAYAPFDGAPSTVNVAAYPSLLYIINNDTTEDHYAFVSGATSHMYCRLSKGVSSYVGIRLQDSGNDNNDFTELRLIDGTSTGLFAIQVSYQVGGGGITTTTLVDDIPPMFYLLRLIKVGNNVYCYYGVDTPIPVHVATIAGMTWTLDRAGILHSQRVGTGGDQSGLFDFVEIA